MMRWPIGVRFTVACAAQAVVCLAQAQSNDLILRLPPLKTSLTLVEGQPVVITAWGTVSSAPAGVFRMAVTVDLGDFQQHLTPVLAAQLNRSDRCGDRLSVERAVLVPAAPSGVLTADVHYERFACVKALGKEIVKRLVGGDAEIVVQLTPSVAENGVALKAEVQKIDGNGSLGEVLHNGSLGNMLREKISAAVESNIQKAANRKTALPAEIESAAAIRSVEFADGGAGRLWFNIGGEVHLTEQRLRDAAKALAAEGTR